MKLYSSWKIKKIKKVNEVKGSITVFLSMILLLILAVVMTTIEGARVSAARTYIDRTVMAALDSVLAEFYQPLFEEYHIFALDSGYGTNQMSTDTLVSKMDDYMEYTFEPSKNLSVTDAIPYEYFNLYGVRADSLSISKVTTIMDYQGEVFRQQAVVYMKYKAIGNGIESFLGKIETVDDTKKAQAILNKKQDTEAQVVKIDEKVLKLMRLVDGINIDNKGVHLNREGNIEVKSSFVKKVCIVPITKEALGINNTLVYDSLQSHYVQPIPIIEEAIEIVYSLYDNLTNKDTARIRYKYLTLIDQSEIKDNEKLNELYMAIAEARNQLQYYTNLEVSLLNSLNNKLFLLRTLFGMTLPAIQDSIKIVDDIILCQEDVDAAISEYEKLLYENKNQVSEALYESLLDDFTLLNKYKKNTGNSDNVMYQINFAGMKDTLIKDKGILSDLLQYKSLIATDSTDTWNFVMSALTHMKSSIRTYSHKYLEFDYSSLKKPVESDSFYQGIEEFLGNGLMGLIIEDMDSISHKEIDTTDIPSNLYEITQTPDPNNVLDYLSKDIGKADTNSVTDIYSTLHTNLLEGSDSSTLLNDIGNILLFQEYMLEHFSDYTQSNQDETLKALNYEIEYILMGKNNDYNNLKAIIMRILLIRIAINLITLMSDSSVNAEARTLAVGFVGFTGLPALIAITKTIIITIWSVVESLVDVAALIKGYSVPLMKSHDLIQIELNDLFHVNKKLILDKSEQLKSQASLIQTDYRDYLKLFLYLEGQRKEIYRAMDIIQKNIQCKYEDSFYVKNCLFGFQVNASFSMDQKFITFPFITKFLQSDYENRYHYKITKEYSY